MHANGMDQEDFQMKARKIKLRLTSHQKTILKSWNDNHRFTYNSAIWRLNTDVDIPNKLKLRNDLVAAENNRDKPWLLETPKEIRARAVFEAHTRVITGIRQIKNKTIKYFQMRFKDRKHQTKNGWCFDIPKQAIKTIDSTTLLIYPNITKKSEFKLKESLPNDIENDCKIQFDGKDYYFVVPYRGKTGSNNDPKREVIVSLDPGVRTFLSGVDTKRTVEIGNKANETMYPLLKKLDRLISKSTKTKTKTTRKNLQKHIRNLRKRIKNLQRELHCKASTWLCKTYQNVVIPDFGVKEMCKKQARKIRTKTVRQMTVLGHKMFLERLKTKAKETNTCVITVDESYTSKTCSGCGFIKQGVYTSKIYKCENCPVVTDRDRNASINIFKRLFLTDESRTGRIEPKKQVCLGTACAERHSKNLLANSTETKEPECKVSVNV
jgi:putative transposase